MKLFRSGLIFYKISAAPTSFTKFTVKCSSQLAEVMTASMFPKIVLSECYLLIFLDLFHLGNIILDINRMVIQLLGLNKIYTKKSFFRKIRNKK